MVRVETTLAVSWRVTYFAALICTAAGVHVRKAQRMLFFIAGGRYFRRNMPLSPMDKALDATEVIAFWLRAIPPVLSTPEPLHRLGIRRYAHHDVERKCHPQ